jgi:hypothetical protein
MTGTGAVQPESGPALRPRGVVSRRQVLGGKPTLFGLKCRGVEDRFVREGWSEASV